MAIEMRIGTVIENRWEVHKILQGGMGTVYIVYDNQLSEPLAAKTFRDEIFNLHPAIADRFSKEAHLWLGLDVHPNIVRARFVSNIGGRPFLFLEYINGGDLKRLITKGRLRGNLPLILRLAVQFCDGMSHALSKGISAHGDIKPRNCLITNDMTLKVTDFGLARMVDEAIASRGMRDQGGIFGRLFGKRGKSGVGAEWKPDTPSMTSAGSPPYMAPELFDDSTLADVRTDIYSTGVMLFQMITGELPWYSPTREEFVKQHRTKPLPPLPPDAPHSLRSIIRRCVSREPGQRFKDFSELRERLADAYLKLTGEPPPNVTAGDELSLRGWLDKGKSLAALGHFKEGIACFDRVLESSPKSASAWTSKGQTYQKLKLSDEAIEAYKKAAELDPENSDTWNALGSIYLETGHNAEAVGCFDNALAVSTRVETFFNMVSLADEDVADSSGPRAQFDPARERILRLVDIHRNKGKALLNLGHGEEALLCFRQALEINPSDARGWLEISIAAGRMKRYMDEIAFLDHATEIDRGYVQAWINKGLAFSNNGQPQKAFECFDIALRFEPRSEQALYNKGAVLANLQWYREALICFDTVLTLNPEHADSWVGKGISLASSGKGVDAAGCFVEASKLGHPDAVRLLEKYGEQMQGV